VIEFRWESLMDEVAVWNCSFPEVEELSTTESN